MLTFGNFCVSASRMSSLFRFQHNTHASLHTAWKVHMSVGVYCGRWVTMSLNDSFPPSNKTNTLGSHFLPLAKHLTWPASTQKHSTKTTLLTGAVPSVQTNVWQCWLLLTSAVPSVLTIFVFCLVCWLLLASDTADYCCSNPNKDFMRWRLTFSVEFSTLYTL